MESPYPSYEKWSALREKAGDFESIIIGLNNFLVEKEMQGDAIAYLHKHSRVDFQSWVIEHNKKNVERIKEKLKHQLSGFSDDEMKIVNELLKSGKIEK